MKKFISAVMALTLITLTLLTSFCFTASADDLPTFILWARKDEIHPGQEVEVIMSLEGMNENICPNGIVTLYCLVKFDATKLSFNKKTGFDLSNVLESIENVSYTIFVRAPGEGEGEDKNTDENLTEIEVSIYVDAEELIPSKFIPSSVSNLFGLTFTALEAAANTETSIVFSKRDLFAIDTFTDEFEQITLTDFAFGEPFNLKIGKELSTNAKLKSLSVKDFELNKKFSSSTTSYAISVPFETDSITVEYEADDEFAKVSVSGNNKLAVGVNNVRIKVTAEDGKTTKTYSITVTRQPEEENSDIPSGDESSDVEGGSSEPPDSSDVIPDSSAPESNPPSDEGSTTVPPTDYEQSLQEQLNNLKDENLKLRDKTFTVMIIFVGITLALLVALIIVSVNYKKDIK